MSFFAYMLKFVDEDSYRGVIANCLVKHMEWRADFDRFYKVRSFLEYLNACPGIMAAFYDCWGDYEREVDRSQAR